MLVDAITNSVRSIVTVGTDPGGIAVGAGAIWVANSFDGTVSRIDARTNSVVATIRVGKRLGGIAVGGGAVWVAVRA